MNKVYNRSPSRTLAVKMVCGDGREGEEDGGLLGRYPGSRGAASRGESTGLILVYDVESMVRADSRGLFTWRPSILSPSPRPGSCWPGDHGHQQDRDLDESQPWSRYCLGGKTGQRERDLSILDYCHT